MMSDQDSARIKAAREIGHGIAWAGFWIGLGLVFIAYAIVDQL